MSMFWKTRNRKKVDVPIQLEDDESTKTTFYNAELGKTYIITNEGTSFRIRVPNKINRQTVIKAEKI